MNKTLTFLLLSLFIVSCKKDIGITEKDVNSVQQVLNFYGGECLRHKGFQTINGETKTYFELEMNKSTLLEKNSENLKSHSGNIAYLFYSSLDDEKSNYNQVRVTINLKNGTRSEFSYSDKEINEIEQLFSEIENVSELIKRKDFESLTNLFDKSIELKTIQLSELFNNLETQFGEINQSQCQGFEFKDSNNFGQTIIARVVQARKKGVLSMLLIFNRNSRELISIEF